MGLGGWCYCPAKREVVIMRMVDFNQYAQNQRMYGETARRKMAAERQSDITDEKKVQIDVY